MKGGNEYYSNVLGEVYDDKNKILKGWKRFQQFRQF